MDDGRPLRSIDDIVGSIYLWWKDDGWANLTEVVIAEAWRKVGISDARKQDAWT